MHITVIDLMYSRYTYEVCNGTAIFKNHKGMTNTTVIIYYHS